MGLIHGPIYNTMLLVWNIHSSLNEDFKYFVFSSMLFKHILTILTYLTTDNNKNF